MEVFFHVNNKNLKANLSAEQTISCSPNPYRALTLETEGQTVFIFMTTRQAMELMVALAEGLIKEPKERDPMELMAALAKPKKEREPEKEPVMEATA